MADMKDAPDETKKKSEVKVNNTTYPAKQYTEEETRKIIWQIKVEEEKRFEEGLRHMTPKEQIVAQKMRDDLL